MIAGPHPQPHPSRAPRLDMRGALRRRPGLAARAGTRSWSRDPSANGTSAAASLRAGVLSRHEKNSVSIATKKMKVVSLCRPLRRRARSPRSRSARRTSRRNCRNRRGARSCRGVCGSSRRTSRDYGAVPPGFAARPGRWSCRVVRWCDQMVLGVFGWFVAAVATVGRAGRLLDIKRTSDAGGCMQEWKYSPTDLTLPELVLDPYRCGFDAHTAVSGAEGGEPWGDEDWRVPAQARLGRGRGIVACAGAGPTAALGDGCGRPASPGTAGGTHPGGSCARPRRSARRGRVERPR